MLCGKCHIYYTSSVQIPGCHTAVQKYGSALHSLSLLPLASQPALSGSPVWQPYSPPSVDRERENKRQDRSEEEIHIPGCAPLRVAADVQDVLRESVWRGSEKLLTVKMGSIHIHTHSDSFDDRPPY